MMHRNKSVDAHQFAMVPRAEIPRASFNIQRTHKTTFEVGMLVPVLCEEVLPGDSFQLTMTAFARMATPLYPVMDNLYLDSFFFFVPSRLLWTNWKKFMGEQTQPGDSISYVIPQIVSPVGGFTVGSIYDYFGLPTVGQVNGGSTVSINALPLRAYTQIFDHWFRDENLQSAFNAGLGDGPDAHANFSLQRRAKRHDYFSSALPWPQKGGTAVTIPLGTSAPVVSSGAPPAWAVPTAGNVTLKATNASTAVNWTAAAGANANDLLWAQTGLVADLSTATAATINQLRQSFQIQKLLERDARGGTRYTEIVRAHFGVISPDARLQRPEYLGGGSTPIIVSPIVQTSATSITGGTTPLGNLAGVGTGLSKPHGFSQSFTEHGYILGIVNVRADLNYQQGLRKMWSRSTRYDFYFPAFANLGEQAILSKELYCDGTAGDNNVFGYQERWAEYRYSPSQITGLFRSTSAGTLDGWHLAQRFTSRPVLDATFIAENPPLDRVLAVPAAPDSTHFLFDSFFQIRAARPMPLYSVPGLIDHF